MRRQEGSLEYTVTISVFVCVSVCVWNVLWNVDGVSVKKTQRH